MSMVRRFHLRCDECFTEYNGDEWWSDEARLRAQKDGWVRRSGRDLCPECSDAAAGAQS